MNFHHLKYFYDSARLKSLTKAAKLNHVGQPAISKAILNIEGSLKKTLISHERNRFQLTEDGEVVYSYCQRIFNTTEELRDSLLNEIKPTGEVRFACPSSLAESDFLLRRMKTVFDKYPGIDLSLMLGRTDLVRDWVQNGQADFGVALNNVDLSDFQTEVLESGFFYLIKAKDFTKDWHETGVFTVENKPEVLELKKNYSSTFNRDLKIKMEIGSWGVIKRFVMSGLGAGFVPDYMIQKELNDKSVVRIDTKKLSVPYNIQLVRKKDKYLSNRCRIIMDQMRNELLS